MNIGIDIDDTLGEFLEFVFPISQKFDIEELGNTGKVKNYGKVENHNHIETMYSHWTEEQIYLFWEKVFMQAMLESRPKPYASEIVNKLKEEGNKIVIITSRYEVLQNDNTIERTSKEWLRKNNIPYDEFILNAKDKSIAAKKAQIDLFIDDSIEHCKSVKEVNIRALLYTSIMNQGLEVPELERVYSWIQIYDVYKKMIGEKL